MIPTKKICTKCRKLLPASSFSTQKDGRYLYPSCRKCKNKQRVEYQRGRIVTLTGSELFKCRGCGLVSGIQNFYKNKRRGATEFCKICFKLHIKRVRENNPETYRLAGKRRKNRVRKFIYDYKLGKPCHDCGRIFPPHVMDFDHVNGKSLNLSLAYQRQWSEERITEEINKCDLVCANCHRIRTQNRISCMIDPSTIIVPDVIVPRDGQSWNSANKYRIAAQRRIRRIEITKFIQSLKDGKPCVDCGNTFPYFVLDFDHEKDKTVNISKISAHKHWDKNRILEEVRKCSIRCANCHRVRSFNEEQHLGTSDAA